MTPGTSVIWLRGAVGMTGTIVTAPPADLAYVSTEFGDFYEDPRNLVEIEDYPPAAVEALKAKFRVAREECERHLQRNRRLDLEQRASWREHRTP